MCAKMIFDEYCVGLRDIFQAFKRGSVIMMKALAIKDKRLS
jgi:hypothetical protein